MMDFNLGKEMQGTEETYKVSCSSILTVFTRDRMERGLMLLARHSRTLGV